MVLRVKQDIHELPMLTGHILVQRHSKLDEYHWHTRYNGFEVLHYIRGSFNV